VDGALAPKMQAAPGTGTSEAPIPDLANAVQPRLFYERPAPNVIPFEAFAPPAPPPARRSRPASAAGGKGTGSGTGTGTRPGAKRAARKPRVSELQEKLDFLAPMPPKPRTLGTSVEAVIYCDAPVAVPSHRAAAALLDWSLVLIAYGLFLAVYRAAGGEFVMNRAGLAVLGGALPLIAVVYMLLHAVAGSETAGMHWTRLVVVTFDGECPERKHWMRRFLGSCLSYGTALGLLWMFADEEGLTWQDHISDTFPTPREFNSQVFQRR
jgi:uncharacterized RDD family membrane protein YckC